VPEEIPTPPPDEHRERALEILKSDDPLVLIPETFNRTRSATGSSQSPLRSSLPSRTRTGSTSRSPGKGKTRACTTI
ncbi:MAG: hypothetical protein WBH70_07980, partial [Candidatus Methanoculleus thermohydrogenotrophicum]